MAALGPEELWTLCATAFHCGTPLESHEGDDRYSQNNLELAKQLIQESGYNGEPLIHMNPNDYGTITPLGPVFKKQMEAVGVNIELPGMDWATLISRIGDLDYWHFFSTWGGFLWNPRSHHRRQRERLQQGPASSTRGWSSFPRNMPPPWTQRRKPRS